MSSALAAMGTYCGYCGGELPDDGTGRLYCNRTHARKAMLWRRLVRDGCAAKIPYFSRYPAEVAARAILRKRQCGGLLRAYECPVGRHWHLTSKPPLA